MKRILAGGLLAFVAACATQQAPSPEAVRDLAPTGKLRAAINFGNSVLAQKDPASGEARGVSVELARELSRRLGVPLELVTYDAAGKVNADAARNVWDIGFFAIDPKRGEEVAFSAAYVVIEGGYAVPAGSPLRSADEVDRPGTRIMVSRGSAYDLYLSRHLRGAELVRAPSPASSFEMFQREGLPALAGVKPALVAWASGRPGFRILDGRFMVIDQAMATPHRQGEAGVRYLREFVEEMKASGFVAAALERSGQKDAAVAPAAR